MDVNQLPIEGEGGLVELLAGIADPRCRRGIRHPIASVLALATLAALAGMRSYEAIAEWVQDLPRDLFRRLRCWCHRAPSEPTFRRVLQSVDAGEIDAKVGHWLAALIARKAISVDGKTLRGRREGSGNPWHLLAAITHESGSSRRSTPSPAGATRSPRPSRTDPQEDPNVESRDGRE